MRTLIFTVSIAGALAIACGRNDVANDASQP